MNDELQRLYRELEASSRHKSEFLANMSPRAAHAAERDHRLHPGAAAEALRRGERQAGGVPGGHPRLRQAPARPDQRHARPVQGRGGPVELEVAPFSLREALERGVVMVRERAVKNGIAPLGRAQLRRSSWSRETSAASARSCSTCSRTRSSSRRGRKRGRHAPPSETARCWSRSRTPAPGSPPEDQERIFEEFQQTEVGAEQREGTGLGLALSQEAGRAARRAHLGRVRARRGLDVHLHAARGGENMKQRLPPGSTP